MEYSWFTRNTMRGTDALRVGVIMCWSEESYILLRKDGRGVGKNNKKSLRSCLVLPFVQCRLPASLPRQ
ncbi:hypothetical protein Mapa_014003 [Marchantia paleacea]|nr:hypothetical protein Mapa_014003 [Marchantia paleacea]